MMSTTSSRRVISKTRDTMPCGLATVSGPPLGACPARQPEQHRDALGVAEGQPDEVQHERRTWTRPSATSAASASVHVGDVDLADERDAALTVPLHRLDPHAGTIGTPTGVTRLLVRTHHREPRCCLPRARLPGAPSGSGEARPTYRSHTCRYHRFERPEPSRLRGGWHTRRTPNRGSREQWRVCVQLLTSGQRLLLGPIGKRPVANPELFYKCCPTSAHALGEVFDRGRPRRS